MPDEKNKHQDEEVEAHGIEVEDDTEASAILDINNGCGR